MDKYEGAHGRRYRKYQVTAELLCIGDRMRGSIFRPCLDVLPATTLEGALRDKFPRPDRCVFAIGRIVEANREAIIYSPRDRVAGASKVPIQTEYLANVRAEVFIRLNDWTLKFPEQFSMRMGAMRAQGCGWTEWHAADDGIEAGKPVWGTLYSRLPDVPKWREAFGIRNVESPVVGYLPIPERGARTYYQRALLEGSRVLGDAVVVLTEGEDPRPTEPPMQDPMAEVLASLDVPENLSDGSTVLATAASVLARYGYAVARLHLQDKHELEQKSKQPVQLALAALDVLESLEPTRSNAELGAFVLKKLRLIPEWQRRFGKSIRVSSPRLEQPQDEFRDSLRSVVEGIQASAEYRNPRVRVGRSFALDVANAVARFGVDATLTRLEQKEQRWAEQRREGKPVKGQSKENMALVRRALQELQREERIARERNVGRMVVRRALGSDSAGKNDASARGRTPRR